MHGTTGTEWQHLAIYAVIAAIVLMLLLRVPVLGRLIRVVFSLGLLAFCIFLLLQQAPFDPNLRSLAGRLGMDRQEVVGEEVRVRMSPDGHFWVNATLNGVKRRMLVDSGATVTAISEKTAAAAKVDSGGALVPVVMQTANGMVQARTGTVDDLRVGNIHASGLKVVITPATQGLDVIGMNFLSELQSWRVEDRTLILVPQGGGADAEPEPRTPSGDREERGT